MSEIDPSVADDPLTLASGRLEQALTRVGAYLDRCRSRLDAAAGEVESARGLDEDRARLAGALDEARAREAQLQAAAEDVSDALDAAMADRQALLHVSDTAGETACARSRSLSMVRHSPLAVRKANRLICAN